jgi:hypothetical protein
MSVSFDWDFRDERSPNGPPRRGGPGRDRIRRRVIRVTVVVVLLILVGLPIRAWLAEQLEGVKKDEEKLRSLIELELKAITEDDLELFRSLQDPLDPNWQERQVERYAASNALTFVPAPGLVSADRPPQIDRVHLFAYSGRVEMTHWFWEAARSADVAADESGEESEPLPFHVTWFYRQADDGNWYHVEPPGDYWGIPYSWHGSRLAVRATEVEAERIDSTARELAILVSQACLWMSCPVDLAFTLSFEDIASPEVRGEVWALPALYYTGLPAGEASLNAWENALKRWVVEMLVRAQVGNEELTERVMYQQLMTRLQDGLGLIHGPAHLHSREQLELLGTALEERSQHPLWSLWQATVDYDDPARTQLLEAEVAALLEFIEGEVGYQRLFELLPALQDHSRLSDALQEVYGLDRVDFSRGWLDYLAELTGVNLVPDFSAFGPQIPEGPLEAPPLPPPTLTPVGDQLAANCGGRIWVANADGSGLVPLTARGEFFNVVLWSPDGRWLLSAWHPSRAQSIAGLYLLAADGSEGRLLTDDPTIQAWPIGWSPDGREAIYVPLDVSETGETSIPSIGAINVETGEARDLPGYPTWSPDGELLLYVTLSREGPMGSAWLADADWGNARPIEMGAWSWPGRVWSADSSMLALALPNDAARQDGSMESAIALYDVTTERMIDSVHLTELTRMFLDSDDPFVRDGFERTLLVEDPLTWASVYGWSADDRALLVWAQGSGDVASSTGPSVLAAIPIQALKVTSTSGQGREKPVLLAYGNDKYVEASWSPTDAELVVFSWVPASEQEHEPNAFLVDLRVGLVYTGTNSSTASWSPDGEWVAFTEQGGVTIVSKSGQVRSELGVGNSACYQLEWNPVADLSRMKEPLQPNSTSSTATVP